MPAFSTSAFLRTKVFSAELGKQKCHGLTVTHHKAVWYLADEITCRLSEALSLSNEIGLCKVVYKTRIFSDAPSTRLKGTNVLLLSDIGGTTCGTEKMSHDYGYVFRFSKRRQKSKNIQRSVRIDRLALASFTQYSYVHTADKRNFCILDHVLFNFISIAEQLMNVLLLYWRYNCNWKPDCNYCDLRAVHRKLCRSHIYRNYDSLRLPSPRVRDCMSQK